MDIVNEIFKRSHPIKNKLKPFGFVLSNGVYTYKKKFMDDTFEAIITIDKNNVVSGKVIELELNEEYTNIYVDQYTGAFVSNVKEEYINILEDILVNCFEKDLYIFDQTKRVIKYIEKQYKDKPEFLWPKYPNYGAIRNKNTKKWYAVIMNVDGSKVGLDKGEVEIIDVKADSNTIQSLKNNKGFHEAYHMNKAYWLTIILNDSLDDEIIFSLIDYSYNQMEESDEWLVPANPKYYDMFNCFDKDNKLLWKQSRDIHVGDIVYLYVGAPVSAILYKCLVEETDIPYEYKDKNLSMNRVMSLSLLKRYKQDKYTYEYLNEIGVKFVRGQRRLSKKITEKLK